MIFRNNNLLAIKGILFKFPTDLFTYISNIFGHGWDRNRAIDSIGNHGNALMGSYLLASSNLTISITGLLTTDTLVALTESGLVGSINTNGVISFTEGTNYGAFEVYRGAVLTGRFCLTERQGSRLINQVTGTLGNGLLGGTLTTVWQRSNALYSETNVNGYSVSETGWVTNNGEALTAGTIIPADLSNHTKCMAWVSGIQQDLQFAGKAQNSIAVIPTAMNFNGSVYAYIGIYPVSVVESVEFEVYIHTHTSVATETIAIINQKYSNTYGLRIGMDNTIKLVNGNYITLESSFTLKTDTSYKIIAGGIGNGTNAWYIQALEIDTGKIMRTEFTSTINAISSTPFYVGCLYDQYVSPVAANFLTATISSVKFTVNGIVQFHLIPNPYSNEILDIKNEISKVLSGTVGTFRTYIDCGYSTYIERGYGISSDGSNFRIAPKTYNNTIYPTYAGYSLIETVDAPMSAFADSRITVFKYSLPNSYEVRKRIPNTYNTDTQATPKLLTYNELKDLENNPKVRITEVDNKITNLKILQ